MAYRIDGNARNRFDEAGEKATPIPAAQAESFRRDIEIVDFVLPGIVHSAES